MKNSRIHATINVRSKVIANLEKTGFHFITARIMAWGLTSGIKPNFK